MTETKPRRRVGAWLLLAVGVAAAVVGLSVAGSRLAAETEWAEHEQLIGQLSGIGSTAAVRYGQIVPWWIVAGIGGVLAIAAVIILVARGTRPAPST